MNIRTGVSMRSRSILPLRRALIDANMPDPVKVDRKPFVPAKTRDQLISEIVAAYSPGKRRAAYAKFLAAKGWTSRKIASRLECTLQSVHNTLYHGMNSDALSVRPPWFEEKSDQGNEDAAELETIRRLQKALGDI